MTAEEYKAKQKNIDDQIRVLNKESADIERAYLSEKIEFTIGEKVKVIEKRWIDRNAGEYRNIEHIAYVRSFHTHDSGETFYTFWKSKKDGSKSSFRLDLWLNNGIKIEAL